MNYQNIGQSMNTAAGCLGTPQPIRKSSILQDIANSIHERISFIEDRQQTIERAIGRLRNPRPATPCEINRSNGSLATPCPDTHEAELQSVHRRLESLCTALGNMADDINSVI